MMGKPNCSWSSNFRINGNLRPLPNWIWVSWFRQALLLCLIRGNMCAKYPRMGQIDLLWIRNQTATRRSFLLFLATTVGAVTLPSARHHSADIPWGRFMSWLLKTAWKSNLSDVCGGKLQRLLFKKILPIYRLISIRGSGRPVRAKPVGYTSRFFLPQFKPRRMF